MKQSNGKETCALAQQFAGEIGRNFAGQRPAHDREHPPPIRTRAMHARTPVKTLPMHDVDSVLRSWEVIELTCIRRALRAAICRGLSRLDGTWEQALLETRPLFKEIRFKCSRYRQSVDRFLAERRLPPAQELEDAVAVARNCRHADQLVCHVGMAAIYAWAHATIDLIHASADGPDDFLDTLEAALYDLQKRDWEQAAAHCRAAGLDLGDIHPIPNPFGVDGSGPCWHLAPIGVDLDW